MRLLVGLLVGQLLPSFFILWYDLPTNSLTNYPTNNRISWIWMRKKMGLNKSLHRALHRLTCQDASLARPTVLLVGALQCFGGMTNNFGLI